ncbi:dihydrofolate reductase, partial [Mesotoga sp. SC_3PWM13N19]
MRVIAVFASTVNGKITLSHDDRSEWTSSEDKKYFKSLTSRIGVVIMGRKTHEAIGRPLSGRLNVVLTRHPERYRNSRELLFTSTTLLELLEELEKRGFKEVCLIGGAETFDQFANQGLINELHITFEPILSKGIKGLGENL